MTRIDKGWIGIASWLALALTASAVQVQFQVNMEIQTATGRFNPATDTVEVRGSFNGWGGGFSLTNSPAKPNIYLGTFDNTTDSPGTALQYKFVIATLAGEVIWEGINNRTLTLESSDQVLPVVFFNNLSVNPGSGVPVTYQVNMAIQVANGAFVPGADIVEARGVFNNWAGGFTLTNSPSHPNIYQGTIREKSGAPGSQIQYKFVIVTAAGGIVWESGNNRAFTLASAAQTLPPVYFNNQAPSDPGPISIRAVLGDKVTVSWNGRPGVYLQRSGNLVDPTWQDVPNSDGQSSMEFTVAAGAAFFRLANLSP